MAKRRIACCDRPVDPWAEYDLERGVFSVVRCQSCTTGFTWPRPSEELVLGIHQQFSFVRAFDRVGAGMYLNGYFQNPAA